MPFIYFQDTPPVKYNLTTDTGEVSVQYPSILSQEDFEAVDKWLDGIKKKIARAVKCPHNHLNENGVCNLCGEDRVPASMKTSAQE